MPKKRLEDLQPGDILTAEELGEILGVGGEELEKALEEGQEIFQKKEKMN